MSESTQSSTERSPFTKPGFIISAALVVALIAAVVVIFFLPKADSTAQPAPASSSAGASSAAVKVSRRGWKECLRAALKHGDGLGSSTEVQVGTRRQNGSPHRSQDLRPGRDRRRWVPLVLREFPHRRALRGRQHDRPWLVRDAG